MKSVPTPDPSSYYDRLTLWTTLARPFAARGRTPPCVHRALTDPRLDGRPSPTRLHDIVFDWLRLPAEPRILDAGCGQGATLLAAIERFGGHGVGVTLSRSQADVARVAADRLGLAERIDVRVQTYDDPPGGPFDLIVAIESLAHSPDPAVSVRALLGALSPRGTFVVVDDMPETDARGSTDLATFQRGWQCPVLWDAEAYRRAFAAAELTIDEHDLTTDYTPRTLPRIASLTRLNRLAHQVVPLPSWRALMDSHLGGLALERLYRHGLMRYRLLVARRG